MSSVPPSFIALLPGDRAHYYGAGKRTSFARGSARLRTGSLLTFGQVQILTASGHAPKKKPHPHGWGIIFAGILGVRLCIVTFPTKAISNVTIHGLSPKVQVMPLFNLRPPKCLCILCLVHKISTGIGVKVPAHYRAACRECPFTQSMFCRRPSI